MSHNLFGGRWSGLDVDENTASVLRLETLMNHSLCTHDSIGHCAGYKGSSQHPSKTGILVPILQMTELRLREQSGLLKVTLLRSGRART